MLYSPRLRDDQIRALYQLKLQARRPMTKLLQEAVDRYLKHVRRQRGPQITCPRARAPSAEEEGGGGINATL